MLVIYPEKLTIQMVKENYKNYIEVIRITLPKNNIGEYQHKDYLSGVMKLGVKREKFGDILVRNDGADIIVSKDISEYIQANILGLTRFSKAKINIVNICVKIMIIILLFIINLRFMLPNGEGIEINSNLSILFVIDTSVSMRALDYNGKKERFEGVINDCCNIVEELSNCKFSIITFGDTAKRLIPFTADSDMVQAELKAIRIEDDYYAKGSSMNLAKNILEKTLKDEKQRKKDNSPIIVFLISDGEITKENEKLESFSNISQYILNGAVLGYGTSTGGKMVNSGYADDPSSELYYIYYYDEQSYQSVTAISKLDEKNLKQIASDLGIDYVQMSKTSNINYKLNEIKRQNSNSQLNEQKTSSYKDIYYYFAIPLVILLIIDFTVQKRRIQ